jgi:UDP-N-acetylglucosamine 4,6-dehydratase
MNILITGGCGSIGSALVEKLATFHSVRVLDNDEYNVFKMQQLNKNVKYLYGDVRDKDRLVLAMNNVEVVYHAAAMKHVHLCEMNPDEAFKTNVLGTMNVRDAAWKNNVKKVVNISTDKAVNPINVLGATKLLAEKLISSADSYRDSTKFVNVRFGNVLGSNGSVMEMFEKDTIEVTDPEMTRFVMTIDDAVGLVIKATELVKGGETFILKMPAFRLGTFVNAFKKEHQTVKIVGRRPGERDFEMLVSLSEMPYCVEFESFYVLTNIKQKEPPYISDSNGAEWLTKEQLIAMSTPQAIQ